jgi:hypothetical protein
VFRTLYLLALAAVAACAGCSLPHSDHPLTDETTSVVDDRLIGHWQAVPRPDEPLEPPQVPPRFVFARLPGKPNVVEMVNLRLDGEEAKIDRAPAFGAKLGEERYLTILDNPDEPKEKQHYSILRYTLEGDVLKLFLLRSDAIGPAIERGDLKGEVVRETPDPDAPAPEQAIPKYKSIRITASPKELADYFTPRGAAPFHPQELVTIVRVEPK